MLQNLYLRFNKLIHHRALTNKFHCQVQGYFRVLHLGFQGFIEARAGSCLAMGKFLANHLQATSRRGGGTRKKKEKASGVRKEETQCKKFEDLKQKLKCLVKAAKGTKPEKRHLVNAKLRLCSDCAGMGADLVALRLLGLSRRVKPVCWSEIDSSKISLYKAVAKACGIKLEGTHKPQSVFDRNHEDSPASDIYVAGYPCPAFSSLGHGRGIMDEAGRGLVGLSALQYVCHHRPSLCILENVTGVLRKKNRPYRRILEKVFQGLNYDLHMKVLNTQDYGIPQSRRRLYMVAIREDQKVKRFKWPEKRNLSVNALKQFLDRGTSGTEILDLSKHTRAKGVSEADLWEKACVLDVGSSAKFQCGRTGRTPCLTKARLQQKPIGFYVPRLKRRLLISEALRLQGYPDQLLQPLLDATDQSESKVGAALGDGMSVNVLSAVLATALASVGVNAKNKPWMEVVSAKDVRQEANRFF